MLLCISQKKNLFYFLNVTTMPLSLLTTLKMFLGPMIFIQSIIYFLDCIKTCFYCWFLEDATFNVQQCSWIPTWYPLIKNIMTNHLHGLGNTLKWDPILLFSTSSTYILKRQCVWTRAFSGYRQCLMIIDICNNFVTPPQTVWVLDPFYSISVHIKCNLMGETFSFVLKTKYIYKIYHSSLKIPNIPFFLIKSEVFSYKLLCHRQF